MASARQILDEITEVLDSIKYKAASGGDVEHRFNIHVDTEELVDIREALQEIDIKTDQP
jgi:hypothetical protein